MDNSKLYDEKTFYRQFLDDLLACKSEVIIESPYITSERMKLFTPIFEELLGRGVKIYVLTRDPKEHSETLEEQSELEIQKFEVMGVQPLLCKGNDHRKLAILDREILWEGSLNILSQIKSREIMRRFEGDSYAKDMFIFLKLGKHI